MPDYNAKSQTLFGDVQTVAGTPEVLGDTDAIATMGVTQTANISTEDYVYDGVLSREKVTDIVDKTREVSFETFFPSAGGTAGTDNKLWDLFEGAGAGHTLVALTSAESSNATVSADVITLEYYKHSNAGDHKKVIISDASGTIDLAIEIGKRAKFSCKYLGNHAISVQEVAGRVADFGTQKSNIAMRVTKDTITTVKLQPIGGAAVANGNICFGKLDSTNHFGFSLERYLLSCLEGYTVDPEAGEVKLTILEEDATATYNPETHLLDYHTLELVWGGGAGLEQRVYFDNLQLTDVQDTTLGAWRGQELTFSNSGTSSNICR